MSTLDELKENTQAFIHKYLDIAVEDESVIASWVLSTWIPLYDTATYLLFVGGAESGKSRAGVLMNALCKQPVVAFGHSESALLVDMDNKYPCTLIANMDLLSRAEKTALLKILKFGYLKHNRIFKMVFREPVSFKIFGYKVILATKTFTDNAIQAQCITIRLDRLTKLTNIGSRDEYIVIQGFSQEAAQLREEIRAHYEGVQA